MSGYTAQDVARMLGLPPGRLRAYLRSGVLSPNKGERGELRFSFQDLLLLRTAEGLVRERVPAARVRSALRKLRERLPDARPLTGVQLGVEGERVFAREGAARWQVESGQVLLELDGVPDAVDERPAPTALPLRRATERRAPRSPPRPPSPRRARSSRRRSTSSYELGCELEEADPTHAEASYRQVLVLAPRHADAHINVGRLMHERGDLVGAEDHYRQALAIRADDATATFNLGVALEDQGRVQAALDAYEAAIALHPDNADAHYNAARLYEKSGDYGASLRHLRAYRDLTRRGR